MTELMFRADPYRKTAKARVVGLTEEGGVVLERTLFYPRGGGQPGDSGRLTWGGGQLEIATAVKDDDGAVIHLPAAPQGLPEIGQEIEMSLDWERRYGHMRMHTALHLLSVVIPLAVTGGAIGAERGRLDFLMPEPPQDKAVLQGQLNMLIERDLPVTEHWITEAELDANPGLVKTLSVQPPRGAGQIRLVRIGGEADPVDLQPCGGTHVGRTAEIGRVEIAKTENKGRQNRRVTLALTG
ncbi:MAG: alanyl-tRNA editing protein [Pseudomonadota bacterium]